MDIDVKRRSVTAGDVEDYRSAPIFQFLLNNQYGTSNNLAQWWCIARDQQLRQTIYQETLWSSAVLIAISKLSSLKWEIEGDAPRVSKFAQDLFLNADAGAGWVSFVTRQLQDYFLTDNGQFTEIVRASTARGSRILGIMHLDSLRCTRTSDPERPVIYRDTKGIEHVMRAHQVFALSDMPSPSETWHGVGFCAASRAWSAILKMASIESYIYDKVSGRRSLALDIVKGMSDKNLRSAIESAKEMREAQSIQGKAYSYMGATVIPILDDTPLEHVRINFAELPDGFDRDKEFNIGVLQYADALGIDPQDLQPLTGRALGSGEQSMILDEKAKGRNLMTWRQGWTHNVNMNLLSDTVTFTFTERDMRDLKQAADIEKLHVETAAARITAGISTAQQEAQILADADEFPREFVPEDTTDAETLADDDKPAQEAAAAEDSAQEEMPEEEEDTEKAHIEKARRAIDLFKMLVPEHREQATVIQPQSPIINVHIPEQKAHTINVNVPEQKTPQVNIEPAQVTVNVPEQKETTVNVAAPVVNVPPAQVTVNVPEQSAPVVNNTVNVPPTSVEFAEGDVVTEVVERDPMGRADKINTKKSWRLTKRGR